MPLYKKKKKKKKKKERKKETLSKSPIVTNLPNQGYIHSFPSFTILIFFSFIHTFHPCSFPYYYYYYYYSLE